MKEEYGQDEIKIRSSFKGITPREFYMMIAHRDLLAEEQEDEMDNNKTGSSGGKTRIPKF